MATVTDRLEVVAIGWDTVTVQTGGDKRCLSLADLKAAARQDDAALRAIYSGLLDAAKRMASERKAVRVRAANLSGPVTDTAAYTWAAVLSDMAGEIISGRIIAADWGQTGSYSYAQQDVVEARRVLAAKGYEVAP